MVIHNAGPVSIVPGWFLCFFLQDSRLVFNGFRWFFLDIQGFCLVVHGFMLVFYIFSRFQVGFSWFFKIPG